MIGRNDTEQSGKRILFVANDPPGATVYRFRCKYLADALRESGWDVEVAWIGDASIRVDHDIVVLHRICMVPEGRALVRAARARGAALVYGTDDLVFDPDAFTAPADARKHRFAPLHAAMGREADAVLVSTDYLGEHARRLVGPEKPVLVARNFMAPELLRLAGEALANRVPREDGSVTLGYVSGTPTHDADLASIAEPLAATLREYPQARLLFVGPVIAPPAVADAAGDRLRRVPLVPWDQVIALKAQIDINLAPLDLTRPFNHAKSEIKFLEAALVGVPTVAGASAGFREALAVDPDAGLLAETSDDWRCLLRTLVMDAEARSDAGRRAEVFTHRYAVAGAHQAHLDAIFRQLAELPRPRSAQPIATVVRRNPLAPRNLARRALRLLKR